MCTGYTAPRRLFSDHRIVPQGNMQRLTESDFGYDVIYFQDGGRPFHEKAGARAFQNGSG